MPARMRSRSGPLEGEVVESLAGLSPKDIDMLICVSRGYGPVAGVLLGLVAAGQARPATGSCRAAGHYRVLKGLS
jgi:hypothetical protein